MTTKQRPTQAKRWEAGPRCTSFSIGDLAREFDTTARTIRFYEANGLIRPARNGLARVYSERDRVRLKLILCGRRCGFSINEISEMLDLYDAPEGEMGQTQYVLAKLRDRREALCTQRRDLEEMLDQLDLVESRMCASLQHHKGL